MVSELYLRQQGSVPYLERLWDTTCSCRVIDVPVALFLIWRAWFCTCTLQHACLLLPAQTREVQTSGHTRSSSLIPLHLHPPHTFPSCTNTPATPARSLTAVATSSHWYYASGEMSQTHRRRCVRSSSFPKTTLTSSPQYRFVKE